MMKKHVWILATYAVFSVILIITLSSNTALAQDYIYWTNESIDTISRANLDGSSVVKDWITGCSSPREVPVDENYVYWANWSGDTIGRANRDGSGAVQNWITGCTGPHGFAVNAAYVYWTNGSGDTIGRANLDGSGAVQSWIMGCDWPCAADVDSNHVYWANWSGHTIGRANLDGTGVDQNWITGCSNPAGIVVDSNHVYWSNSEVVNSLGRANLDGSGVDQNWITGCNRPNGIAIDTNYIYWANMNGNTIGRANLDGSGAVQNWITGCSNPAGVTAGAEATVYDDAVAYWKFDDGSGMTAADETGNHNGTMYGFESDPWTEGMVNGALYFDGVNDYIRAPSNGDFDFGTGPFSIAFWVKFASLPSWSTIVGNWEAYGDDGCFRLSYQIPSSPCPGGEKYFRFYTDGPPSNDFCYDIISPDTWYHVAMVKNASSELDMFIDCSSLGSQAVSGNLASPNDIIMGEAIFNPNEDLHGTLDELAFWDRALDQGEIDEICGSQTTINDLVRATSGSDSCAACAPALTGSYPHFTLRDPQPDIYEDYITLEGLSAAGIALPIRTVLKTLDPAGVYAINPDGGGSGPPDGYWEYSYTSHDGKTGGVTETTLPQGEKIAKFWQFADEGGGIFEFWVDVYAGGSKGESWLGQYRFSPGTWERSTVVNGEGEDFMHDDGTAEVHTGSTTGKLIIANRFSTSFPVELEAVSFYSSGTAAGDEAEVIIYEDPIGSTSGPDPTMEVWRKTVVLGTGGFHEVPAVGCLVLNPGGLSGAAYFVAVANKAERSYTLGVDMDGPYFGASYISTDGGLTYKPLSGIPIIDGNAMIRVSTLETGVCFIDTVM